VTTKLEVRGLLDARIKDFSVTPVLLVMFAVAVSLIVNSAQAADVEIAEPPVVVVPAMLVHVVLS
jgi:hypothetical protein